MAGTVVAVGVHFVDATQAVGAYEGAATQGKGFDVVFDTLGGAVLDASLQSARRYTGARGQHPGLGCAFTGTVVLPRS